MQFMHIRRRSSSKGKGSPKIILKSNIWNKRNLLHVSRCSIIATSFINGKRDDELAKDGKRHLYLRWRKEAPVAASWMGFNSPSPMSIFCPSPWIPKWMPSSVAYSETNSMPWKRRYYTPNVCKNDLKIYLSYGRFIIKFMLLWLHPNPNGAFIYSLILCGFVWLPYCVDSPFN